MLAAYVELKEMSTKWNRSAAWTYLRLKMAMGWIQPVICVVKPLVETC